MSEFVNIVSLEQKRLELESTVMQNRASYLFKKIIADTLKKDAVEEKMKMLRASSLYEKSAVAYYNKYGTQGEF